MDSSFHEQESGTQEVPKSFFERPSIFVSLIKWLTGLLEMTEEEREDAGIYIGRPGPGGE